MDKILDNCHYVPISVMKKVINIMESPERNTSVDSRCRRNILHVQQRRTKKKFVERHYKYLKFYAKDWKNVFKIMCWKAIYSHDWDKLVYLLKKVPPWEQQLDFTENSLYIRALVILLMYHPSSQSQGLLNDYLHLVWSARSDEDKKAVLKVLLTLPTKIKHITFTNPDDIAAQEEKDLKTLKDELPTKYQDYFHE